jgi:hypothetical protein
MFICCKKTTAACQAYMKGYFGALRIMEAI